jgi:hypothetical protein
MDSRRIQSAFPRGLNSRKPLSFGRRECRSREFTSGPTFTNWWRECHHKFYCHRSYLVLPPFPLLYDLPYYLRGKVASPVSIKPQLQALCLIACTLVGMCARQNRSALRELIPLAYG